MDVMQPRLRSRALIGTVTATGTGTASAAPCTPSTNPTTPSANSHAPTTMPGARSRRADSTRRANGAQTSQALEALQAKGVAKGVAGRVGGGGGGWWRRQLIPSAVLVLCTLAATIETAGANSCSYLELMSYSTCAGGKPHQAVRRTAPE